MYSKVTFALIYGMVGEGHKSARKKCRQTPFGRLVENHRDQLLSEDEGLTPKTKKVRTLRVRRKTRAQNSPKSESRADIGAVKAVAERSRNGNFALFRVVTSQTSSKRRESIANGVWVPWGYVWHAVAFFLRSMGFKKTVFHRKLMLR